MSDIETKLENLTNEGMIDLMHHQYTQFKALNKLQINLHALWRRWIRTK